MRVVKSMGWLEAFGSGVPDLVLVRLKDISLRDHGHFSPFEGMMALRLPTQIRRNCVDRFVVHAAVVVADRASKSVERLGCR